MDSGIFNEIWIGVVIGVAVFLISPVIKDWATKGIFYLKIKLEDDSEDKGLHISGKWKTAFKEGGQDYSEKVSLELIGDKVKGEIELIDPNDHDKITDTYRFKGVFKERVLTATWVSNDPTDYEMGAFALIYEKKEFKGQYIFFSSENRGDEIIASDYEWEKLE